MNEKIIAEITEAAKKFGLSESVVGDGIAQWTSSPEGGNYVIVTYDFAGFGGDSMSFRLYQNDRIVWDYARDLSTDSRRGDNRIIIKRVDSENFSREFYSWIAWLTATIGAGVVDLRKECESQHRRYQESISRMESTLNLMESLVSVNAEES